MQRRGEVAPSSGKIAFRYGLIFGLIQVAINTTTSLSVTFLSASTTVGVVLFCLALLTGLAAYFVSGMMGARETGMVKTGTVSGLLTGVFYGVPMFIISMILFFNVNLPRLLDLYSKNGYPSGLTAETARVASILGGVGFGIFGLLLAIGLGAGIGALGGLLGKNMAKPNASAYAAPNPAYSGQPYPPQQPYQGQPYPPQQPYQGQPYPPQQPYQGQSYPPQQSYSGPSYPGQPYTYTQPNPSIPSKPSAPLPTPPPAAPTQDESNPYNID